MIKWWKFVDKQWGFLISGKTVVKEDAFTCRKIDFVHLFWPKSGSSLAGIAQGLRGICLIKNGLYNQVLILQRQSVAGYGLTEPLWLLLLLEWRTFFFFCWMNCQVFLHWVDAFWMANSWLSSEKWGNQQLISKLLCKAPFTIELAQIILLITKQTSWPFKIFTVSLKLHSNFSLIGSASRSCLKA